MKKPDSEQKKYEWLTPAFYPRAYNRFNRLRWGIEPFNGKYYTSNLDPHEFKLSDDEADRVPLSPFMAIHVMLSIERLVGEINQLSSNIFALQIWQKILRDYGALQRMHLESEFVEPLANSCMLTPFALRNQIVFTGTKLAILFETGRLHTRLPDDREIELKHFRQWAAHWKGFAHLERSLKKLNDAIFIQRTNNFRHRYTHRIPPRIGRGLAPNFRFERDGPRLKVHFSPEKPLQLHKIIRASIVQHRLCVKSFQIFRDMIRRKLLN